MRQGSMILLATGLMLAFFSAAGAQEPDPRYWRLDQIRAQFDAWATSHPDIFHQTVLGESGEGAPIPAARISDNASIAEAEPRLLFHAAQHANEVNGTGAVMKSMARLLKDYGVDPAVTARVDGMELWFVPVLNVDGHDYVFGGAEHWDDWRKTLRDNDGDEVIDFPEDGVDTNRNWDWYWDDYSNSDPQYDKGPHSFSEPEVAALRDFVLAQRPVIVVDYHSPVTIGWSNIIFYPWMSQHGGGQSPDYQVASDIAAEWAYDTRTHTGNRYSSIFGYDTLPKEQCWVYGKCGILAFVMEISDRCFWSGATVDSIAVRVARGSETLQDRLLTGPGITGIVSDAVTGAPLVAEVRLDEMHAPDVGPRLTDGRYGQFHRLTESGYYTVRVSCEGYTAETRTVLVGSSGWTAADFALAPDLTAVVESAEGDPAWMQIRSPARAGASLRLALPAGSAPVSVDVLDVRGRRQVSLGRNLAPGRAHELELPGNLAAGVYLIRARAGKARQVERVVLLP